VDWLTQYKDRLNLDYESDQHRMLAMTQVNPKYILRTHLAEEVIQQVSKGNFTLVDDWMKLLADPFAEHPQFDAWAQPPSEQDKGICLSCSS
jgi:uncharacterized protein YdiU (UPF0061 family)